MILEKIFFFFFLVGWWYISSAFQQFFSYIVTLWGERGSRRVIINSLVKPLTWVNLENFFFKEMFQKEKKCQWRYAPFVSYHISMIIIACSKKSKSSYKANISVPQTQSIYISFVACCLQADPKGRGRQHLIWIFFNLQWFFF